MATLLHTPLRRTGRDHLGTRFYRPELDGLRFAAFLLVFCCHCFFNLTPGSAAGEFLEHVAAGASFGVDLFFVLSAYLITELLRREKLATGTVDVGGFYMRRILRIWPLYFGFLAICFLAGRLGLGSFPFHALIAFVLFCGNWYMAASGQHFQSPATPFWSISVEEQFYLIWPVVARFASKTGMAVFAACLATASWMAQWRLFRAGAAHSVIWVDSLAHGGAIGLGILSAVLLDGRAPSIRRSLRAAMCLGALALFGVADARFHFAARYVSTGDGMSAYGCGLLGVALLFYGFLGAPRNGVPFLESEALLYLGRISYGLYVFHVGCLDLVKYLLLRYTGSCSPEARGACALPLTLLLAAASYRWFESPFLRLKRRFTRVPSGAG